MNEKGAPDLLPYETDLIARVFAAVAHQVPSVFLRQHVPSELFRLELDGQYSLACVYLWHTSTMGYGEGMVCQQGEVSGGNCSNCLIESGTPFIESAFFLLSSLLQPVTAASCVPRRLTQLPSLSSVGHHCMLQPPHFIPPRMRMEILLLLTNSACMALQTSPRAMHLC